MPETETSTEPLQPPTGRTRADRYLNRNQVAALLALDRAGKTQAEIAQTLGIDRSNVTRWLQKLGDTTEIARHRLKAGAYQLAERVIRKGNVSESLEVLDRLEVAPRRQLETNRTAVQINIGIAGEPAGKDPFHHLPQADSNTLSLPSGDQASESLSEG